MVKYLGEKLADLIESQFRSQISTVLSCGQKCGWQGDVVFFL